LMHDDSDGLKPIDRYRADAGANFTGKAAATELVTLAAPA